MRGVSNLTIQSWNSNMVNVISELFEHLFYRAQTYHSLNVRTKCHSITAEQEKTSSICLELWKCLKILLQIQIPVDSQAMQIVIKSSHHFIMIFYRAATGEKNDHLLVWGLLQEANQSRKFLFVRHTAVVLQNRWTNIDRMIVFQSRVLFGWTSIDTIFNTQ